MDILVHRKSIDTRRVVIFLAFAFGIAWATGLVIYLTGGLAHGSRLTPAIPLAAILLAFPYMWAPALAHILTRLVTREGWKDVGLRPRFRHGWPYWLLGWVLPGILTIVGGVVFYLLFPQYFDATLAALRPAISRSPRLAGLSPWAFVAVEVIAAILTTPILNSIATFGEEFGWRAYLLPKLMPLGWRKAVLLLGAIWGIWHWPVIFMGYEYGFKYPGYPWVGPLLFIWIVFCFGTFLAWITLRGGSVWPAVIGHAAINGIAALPVLALHGSPNVLLGPVPTGIIGAIGFEVLALVLFVSPLGKVELPAATSSNAPASSGG